MDMPEPTTGHLRLEQLAGKWEGEETMHPSDWDPKGGTAFGRNSNRIALNGFILINDYEQERDGVITYTGHGVMSYDPNQDLYQFHWFDCIGSPPEIFQGRFDGNILSLSHGGPGMHARMTYDLTEPDAMTTRMEMSQDGESWKTLFDSRYKRV